MEGLDRRNAGTIRGIEHLRQSITDILTTPIGTRVERREYGSRIPKLVDEPINRETQIEIFAATARALRRWEPRLRVQRVRLPEAGTGWVVIDIDALFVTSGEPVTLSGIVVP